MKEKKDKPILPKFTIAEMDLFDVPMVGVFKNKEYTAYTLSTLARIEEETARLKEENARIKEQIAKVKEETRRLEKEIAKNLIAASSYSLSEIAKITGLEEYELKNLSS